ncbi:hypothetical protein KL86PLE_120013 [uncultured Pleomorphomonas sp.]|uniref:Uncharacterized protein n=1 Tax=uncultured Pleomorphomonas sp. TaxID=442121 RepID=A0A212L7W7_9HYPH|nr:hypothetical protein KL86PLE_120013 [uncultured Pleomorphomonas sp.]
MDRHFPADRQPLPARGRRCHHRRDHLRLHRPSGRLSGLGLRSCAGMVGFGRPVRVVSALNR